MPWCSWRTVDREDCVERWREEREHAPDVAAYALSVICRNLDSVASSPHVQELTLQDIEKIATDSRLRCKESSLMELVLNWVRSRPDRKEHIDELLGLVRLTRLPRSFLGDVVGAEPLILGNRRATQLYYDAVKFLMRRDLTSWRQRDRVAWQADTDHWTTFTPSTHIRFGSVAVCDMTGTIYGASVSSGAIASISPGHDDWMRLPVPVPEPHNDRCEIWNIVVIDNVVFGIGTLSKHQLVVRKYKRDDKEWRPLFHAYQPSDKYTFVGSICVYNSRITLTLPCKSDKHVLQFDPKNRLGGFTRLCALPDHTGTEPALLCTVAGRLWVVGSSKARFNMMSMTSVYDAETGSWRDGHSAKKGEKFTMATGTSEGLVVGGCRVDEYDVTFIRLFRDGTWSELPVEQFCKLHSDGQLLFGISRNQCMKVLILEKAPEMEETEDTK